MPNTAHASTWTSTVTTLLFDFVKIISFSYKLCNGWKGCNGLLLPKPNFSVTIDDQKYKRKKNTLSNNLSASRFCRQRGNLHRRKPAFLPTGSKRCFYCHIRAFH